MVNRVLLFIVVVLTIVCCSSRKNAESTITSKEWGYRYYEYDTLNDIRYNMFHSTTKCFPGFSEFENNIDSVEITIYDRWGTEVYHSTDKTENWICNDSTEITQVNGTYVYQCKYLDRSDSMAVKTWNGQITVM